MADLASLEALIDLCRRKGVAAVEWEGVKLALGPAPAPSNAVDGMRAAREAVAQQLGVDPKTNTDGRMMGLSRELTHDEILFASSAGFPADDEPGGTH